MIKVLIVITNGLNLEGITLSQLDYARHIDKNRFEMTYLACHNDSKIVIDELNSLGHKVVKMPDRKKGKMNFLRYLKAYKDLIKKNKYDIIHIHGSSSIMYFELHIAKKMGVKVRIVHSRNTQTDHPKIDKILRPLFNNSYNYALACGKDAGDWLFKNKTFEIFHNR